MLKGYAITEDLNEYELRQVLPIILGGLRSKIGQDKAVSNNYICKAVNDSGKLNNYKLNPVKLRKIMQHIRLNGLLYGLCSSSKGYYVSANSTELMECINSLDQRIRQQERVVDALKYQLIDKYGKQEKKDEKPS